MTTSHRVVSLFAVALALSLIGVAEADVNVFWRGLGGSESGSCLSQTPSGNTAFSPAGAVGADGRPVVTYVESAMSISPVPSGPGPVPLRSAGTFAILAGSTVTNTGPTVVIGDLGLSPGTSVTGFPPGIVNGVMHVTDAVAAQAQVDLTAAFNAAAGRTPSIPVDGNLGGLTLTPGIYRSTSSLEILSGDLTLDAQGDANAVWIFQIASTLTTTSDRKVILTGGAQAANVVWQVGSSATLGTNSVFAGTIMALTSITLTTGATLDGRALARNGAVTLDSNTVTNTVTETVTGAPSESCVAGAIVVKRWTGTAWQALSGPGGIGQGCAPQIRISANGTLYVAWRQDEGPAGVQVHLLRLTPTGSAWEPLDGSDSPGGLTALTNGSSAGAFSLAVGADGNPIVAFDTPAQTTPIPVGNDGVANGFLQVYVTYFNSTTGTWDYLGSNPSTGGGASNAASLLLEGPFFAKHFASNPSLAVTSSGAPTLAFEYHTFHNADFNGGPPADFISGNTEIFAVQWNAELSMWVNLGPAVPQSDDGDGSVGHGGVGGLSATAASSILPSMGTGPHGDIWVAWNDGGNVFARRWNATLAVWEEIDGSASGTGLGQTGGSDRAEVVVDSNDNPIVVWSGQNSDGLRQIFIKRLNYSIFEEMGPDSADFDGISAAQFGALTPMIAAPLTGIAGPAVAWMSQTAADALGQTQICLRQFTTAVAFTLNVTLTGSGSNGSSVTSMPIGIECPSDTCSAPYPNGQVVRLTPQAGPNAVFDKWVGCPSVSNGVCSLTMNATKDVTANFVAGATLTVQKTGTGAGFGVVTGNGITCGADCQQHYPAGRLMTLTVRVPAGTVFTGWSDDCSSRGTARTCSLTMDADHTAIANFTQTRVALTVTNRLNGAVVGTAAGVQVINCGGGSANTLCSTTQDFGTPITMRAVPDDGFVFSGWLRPVCTGPTSTCVFPLKANITATPTFRMGTVVTASITGNGAGVVKSVPGGINCGRTCAAPFFDGKVVTLIATASHGSHFDGWVTPICTGGQNSPSCSFVPAHGQEGAVASFTLNRATLTVTNGLNGSVVGTAGGVQVIDCGDGAEHTVCSTTQDFGTPVMLHATADTGFMFARWQGPICSGSTNSTCAFPLKANITATPTYRARTAVVVTKAGTGSGTVMSSPGGISCGRDCQQAFVGGGPVTFRATAASGSTFIAWGDGCAGVTTATCTITPTGDTETVSARFEKNSEALTITVTGDGFVTVGGLVCETTCPFGALFGDTVVVVPHSNNGNRLLAFTGCTRVDGSSCSVLMNANKAVTATFSTTLSITKTGAGTGTVTPSPAGASCGVGCFTFRPGTSVTLREAVGTGSTFAGWGDDCASRGLDTSCTVVMTSNRAVTAGFSGASSGPGPVPLRSAGNVAILAGSTVTNTGPTVVTGDLGLSPGTSVTGFPPGIIVNGVMHVTDAVAAQAQVDLTAAFNNAAGQTPSIPVDGNLGDRTLTPGIYRSTSSLEISSGDLTLDAQGDANAVWIFQIASTLTTTSDRKVILTGGAQAANVVWQVGSSATLGTGSVFKGTIMALTSITLTTGATLDGRALARNGAVTLDSNIVTRPAP